MCKKVISSPRPKLVALAVPTIRVFVYFFPLFRSVPSYIISVLELYFNGNVILFFHSNDLMKCFALNNCFAAADWSKDIEAHLSFLPNKNFIAAIPSINEENPNFLAFKIIFCSPSFKPISFCTLFNKNATSSFFLSTIVNSFSIALLYVPQSKLNAILISLVSYYVINIQIYRSVCIAFYCQKFSQLVVVSQSGFMVGLSFPGKV